MVSKVAYSVAWQKNDPDLEAAVRAFWARSRVLRSEEEAAQRVKQLCVVAYLGDEIVGVSTIKIDLLHTVRERFGFFRCLVAPEHRQLGLATQLTARCWQVLEAWSAKNPHERLMGMATIVQSTDLDEKGRQPIWPLTGLRLVGHTPENYQVRMNWFKHARLGNIA